MLFQIDYEHEEEDEDETTNAQVPGSPGADAGAPGGVLLGSSTDPGSPDGSRWSDEKFVCGRV